MVLGNKCDMNDRREVTKDRGSAVNKPCLSLLENSSVFGQNFHLEVCYCVIFHLLVCFCVIYIPLQAYPRLVLIVSLHVTQ